MAWLQGPHTGATPLRAWGWWLPPLPTVWGGPYDGRAAVSHLVITVITVPPPPTASSGGTQLRPASQGGVRNITITTSRLQ